MRKNIIIGLLAGTIGLAAGYSISLMNPSGKNEMETAPGSDDPLYWVAPMDPNFRRDEPGLSPMGMALVPVFDGQGQSAHDTSSLQINPVIINNLGIRTAVASLSDLPREINTVGFLAEDMTKTSHVHVKTAGWVEKLYKKVVGETVQKGELIFELYSPELVSAQGELVQSLKLKKAGLIRASKDRLAALGMTSAQIQKLEKTSDIQQLIEVRAPQDGVIMKLEIGEGMYVEPRKTIFSLSDLSTIWVMVDVFESQSGWVSEGQQATMRLPYFPGKEWRGTVDYVYPMINMKTRAAQVRLVFENANGQLKPYMYAEINLDAAPIKNALSVPREALIRTGKTDRVILALEGGRFHPAEVIAGRESGDRVEILQGLSKGERVVTSGQFLIDSEASINSSLLRMLDAEMLSETMAANNKMMDEKDMLSSVLLEGAPIHRAEGVINAFAADGSLNISHGPIDSLQWPSMTMGFFVAEGVDLSDLFPGDKLAFDLQKNNQGSYTLIAAKKIRKGPKK